MAGTMAGRSALPRGEHFVEKFARHALAARVEDFPEAAWRQAELLLLDTIACGYGAKGEHSAEACLDVVREGGGAARCTIIGERERSGAGQAVFANGVLIRVLDMNDYVPSIAGGEFGGHPSDNIPVALAAGEMAGASGRDTLASIIIGYEIYGRAMGLIDRGQAWDNVSGSGFAAPVMAGRLMGLDAAKLAHALSLTLARAPTSALARVGDVSALKSIANALVAQHAMQSTQLAARGVTGPMPLFEHQRGLQAAFPGEAARERLLAPMEEARCIRAARIKDFPCLAVGQTVAAAGIAMCAKTGGRALDIETIDITMADTRQIRQHLDDPSRNDPRSREAADHSYQFIFGAALVEGDLGLAQFEKELWNEPAMRDLISRTRLSCDATVNTLAPDGFPCRVKLTTKAGEVFELTQRHPPGYSPDGLKAEAVTAKFERLAAPHIDASRRARIVETCLSARKLASVGALMALVGQ